jgi:hypothetical protein
MPITGARTILGSENIVSTSPACGSVMERVFRIAGSAGLMSDAPAAAISEFAMMTCNVG